MTDQCPINPFEMIAHQHPIEKWKKDVAGEQTLMGYYEWVEARIRKAANDGTGETETGETHDE